MEKAAKILSIIFSPLLVPTIAIAIALWGTMLVITPNSVKIHVVLMTLFITGAVPAIVIAILHYFKKVSDATISNPRERTIPFIVAVLCYMGEAFYLMKIHAPLWLCNFMISAMMAIIIIMIVNVFWKVSAHTCAMGGCVALVAWLISNNLALPPMFAVLLIAIIVTGMVGSARLVRRLHTLPQVIVGAVIGFVSVYFIPEIIKLFM